MRYAVAYPKGGVGKTTVAVHLAAHLAKEATTLLIDTDPQESAATWLAWRHERPDDRVSPRIARLTGNRVYDQGSQLVRDFTYTVIDVGARDTGDLRNALLLSDRLIIPVGNSAIDTAILTEFLDLVHQAQRINKTLKYRVLMTRIKTSTDKSSLLAFLDEREIPYFHWLKRIGNESLVKPIFIGERQVYPLAMAEGLTADEYRPMNSSARHDLKLFFKEIALWLDQ